MRYRIREVQTVVEMVARGAGVSVKPRLSLPDPIPSMTGIHRGIIVVAGCFALMGTLRSPVHGQSVVTLAPDVPDTAQAATPVAHLVLGSAAGWLVGTLAGATLGLLVQPRENYPFAAAESLISAWIGSSVGSSLGAHLANGSRGHVGWGLAASFVIAPAAALVATPFSAAPVAVPVAQIGVSVIVERRTAASRR